MRLQGKIALVTGASRGIGQATAVALAAEGARVAVNYNATPEGAEETLKRIRDAGGEAEALHADMGQRDHIARRFAQTVERFGRIDLYVNNANAESRRRDAPRTVLDVGDEELFNGFYLPYRACYVGGQLAAKQMIKQGGAGAIANITSVHQDRAWPAD